MAGDGDERRTRDRRRKKEMSNRQRMMVRALLGAICVLLLIIVVSQELSGLIRNVLAVVFGLCVVGFIVSFSETVRKNLMFWIFAIFVPSVGMYVAFCRTHR